MVTVSLCMIVKNEAKVLARCLESVRNMVDEIVIIDTGSTDATREIALRYTDNVFDFPWRDDFSAARNFSFSKATMEFILWLDADDVFTRDDRLSFLRLKRNIPDDVSAVMMRYHTAFDETGKPVFSYYRERLIRRSAFHSWKGRVHETIEYAGQTLYDEECAVTHRSVKTSYSDRNLRIYEKQLAEEKTLSPRDMFYYGRELYYHKKYEQAKEVLSGFLADEKGWAENKIEACKILSHCCRETEDIPRALHALYDSFLYDAPRAELCCELGALYMQLAQYRTAVFWFEAALQIPANEKSGAFVSADCHGYLPCIQLCVCYDHLGDLQRAKEYNRRAGAYRPLSPAYLYNLKYFSSIDPAKREAADIDPPPLPSAKNTGNTPPLS